MSEKKSQLPNSGDEKKSKPGKYDIVAVETKKNKIPLRKCMLEGVLPKFPFSLMLSGRSGSGKTNLAMNLLTRKEFYGNYFHYTLVFSPTASKYDDSYDVLKLPKENFVGDFNKEFLDKLIDVRKDLIDKKGIEWVAKNSRVLIIMDDCIADRQFLESPEALKMFALLRHYLVSVMIMIQSYTKLPRALRVNCNGVMVFPCLASERKILIDEVTPSNINKKDFGKVLDYCTDGRWTFMYINNHADPKERIRKNIGEVIDLEKYRSP